MSLQITVDVPAPLQGEPAKELASRARLLLVIDLIRSGQLTRPAAARALGMALDAFLIIAARHGLESIDYDLADFQHELDDLAETAPIAPALPATNLGIFMIVVADSSPLIYLSRLEVLELLPAIYGEIVVPAVVWSEVIEQRPAAPGVEALRAAAWLRVAENPVSSEDLGLDPGETAAILLAQSLGADALLIDERAGRAVAQGRGLRVRGTIGILILARETGRIPALRPVLLRLEAMGFRLAPAIAEAALRRVGE